MPRRRSKFSIQSFSYKTLFIVVFFLLIAIVALLKLTTDKKVSAAWWNDGWHYRKAVSITNSSGSNLTDFQVAINIGTSALINAGKMKTDCSDIRIIDQEGNQLPHWIEENNPGCNQISDTKIWIKTTSLPTSGTTLYLYYGNPSASNTQNGNDVFLEFDDFNNSSSINNWTLESNPNTTYSISGGTMAAINTSNDYSSAVIGTNYADIIVNSRFQVNINQTHGGFVFRGQTNAADNSYQWVIRRGNNDNRIQKRQNGVQSYLLGGTGGTVLPTTLTANTWYPVEFRVNGSSVNTYFNNQLAANGDMADVSFSSGKIGILSFDGNEFYDYIFVRKFSSVEPTTTPQSEEAGGGPVAYWKFDEGSGTTAYDSTSTSNINATLYSNASWATEDSCISGNCVFIDDSGTSVFQTIRVSDSPSLGNLPAITVSTWIKTTSNKAQQQIIYKRQNAGTPAWYSFTLNLINLKPSFNLSNTAGTIKTITSTTAIELNKWYLITATYNGSQLELYINSKVSASPVSHSGTILDSDSFLMIGGLDPANSYYFKGFIDEPKIYPYARTADQIKSDYAAGKAHASSNTSSSVNLGGNKNSGEYLSDGLVGYWKMDEGVGTTTLDSSGNNITGTFVGTTKPTWTLGKYSNGISFSGTNDSLSIPYKPDFREALTVSIWMKRTTDYNQLADIMFLSPPNAWYFYDSYNTGQIRGDVYIDGTRRGGINVPVPFDNNWYHIVYTYDSTTHLAKMYKNGTLFQTLEITGLTNYLIDIATGNLYNPGLNSKGRGIILDEARIYNRALSSSEISDLYNWSPNGNSPKKPIVYYKFDEGYGTTVNNNGTGENILNGTFGTSTTAPLWTNSGKINKALDFNTTNNTRIKTPITDTNGLNIRGAISYSAWFKRKTTSGYHTLIDMLDSCAADGDGFYLRFTNTTLSFYGVIDAGTDPFVLSFNNENITGDTSKWHHVVVTWNGTTNTNGVKMYIDGKLVAQSTANADTTNMESLNGHSLSIGTLTCNTHSFDGLIDEVKIYNTALTDEEVKLDYNQGSSLSFGSNSQTIGSTTTSLDYCIPGDTSPCSSPIAEWKFDEGVGTTAYDNSGNNNHATLGIGASTPSWTQGKVGKSLTFDGIDDRLTIGTTLSLGNTDWTVSAWMKTTNTGSAALISNSSGGPVTNNLLIMNSKITYAHYDGTWKYESGTSNIADGKWHYLTWANHNNQTIDLYVDNEKELTAAPSTVTNSGPVNQIGRNWGTSSNASIDNIRIYNYARTPAQIAYDYNKGAPVGWWKFDECQGNIAYDWSGIGNTGSINVGPSGTQNSLGTCQVGTSAAWTNGASGKYNSSLNFDGIDDYFQVPHVTVLEPSSISVSAWVKLNSDSTRHIILAKWFGYTLEVDSNGIPSFQISNTQGQVGINAGTSISWGTWHLLTGTFDDSTKIITLYIDGVAKKSNTLSSSIIYNQNVLRISNNLYGGGAANGQIDDVRIYNYALTPTQIKTLFNNGSISFN